MNFDFFKTIGDTLFGKGGKASQPEESDLVAHFELEGINPDGSYVFVSRGDLLGRSILGTDGSFYFIRMPDPDDKESLNESDRRLFFSVKFLVRKEELDEIKKLVIQKEEELEQEIKKKKKLEAQIEEMHKENERLAAIPRREQTIESLDTGGSVKQNPVTVEAVAEISGNEIQPTDGLSALESSRTLFADYEVTNISEQDELELSDILQGILARNVPKNQMDVIVNIFMQNQKTGDAETYLRLAAFVTCVATIRSFSAELAKVPDRKKINHEFMDMCAEILRNRDEDSAYEHLLFRDKLAILIKKLEPAKRQYAENVENAVQNAKNASQKNSVSAPGIS